MIPQVTEILIQSINNPVDAHEFFRRKYHTSFGDNYHTLDFHIAEKKRLIHASLFNVGIFAKGNLMPEKIDCINAARIGNIDILATVSTDLYNQRNGVRGSFAPV